MNTIVPRLQALESRLAPSTFTVTTLADTGAGSLRQALADADAHIGSDTIVFHLPAPPLHSENIIRLTTGELTSKGKVTISGPGAGRLIIDGNNASRILDIDDGVPGADSPVSISGLSSMHGFTGIFGGGIYSLESLNLRNVVISGNRAGAGGGGVAVVGNVKATVRNSLITSNHADSFAGGLDFGLLASITIRKTLISGNTAGGGGGANSGGGLYASIRSTGTGMVITGSQISGNSAGYAGGLVVKDNNPATTSKITISGTTITGNIAFNTTAIGGGGLFAGIGNTVITGSTISNNTAVYDGGGIQTGAGFGSLTISKSSISGNHTTATNAQIQGGGGIFIQGNSAATLQPVRIISSRFTGNGSEDYGGGLLAIDGIALTISGSTFLDNHAAVHGGGVWARGFAADKVDLIVNGGTFSANVAAQAGGGIGAFGDGALDIEASKVAGNTAFDGGGMSVGTTGLVTIKNAVVTGNLGKYEGGGIEFSLASNFHVSGGSIKNNAAGSYGGAVFLSAVTGSIRGVTISGNAAGSQGGGLFNNGGAVTLQIAKVFANNAPLDPDVHGAFTFV